MERKNSCNIAKTRQYPSQTQSNSNKDLLLTRLARFKSIKKKNTSSPRLPSNYSKNKQNHNQNQMMNGQHPPSHQRPPSKVRPKLQEIKVTIDKPDQLKGFLSNKGRQVMGSKPFQEDILCEGISKDGVYKIQSKALVGDELKKAVEWEYKHNYKSKKEKTEAKEAKTPRNSKLPPLTESRTSTKENSLIKAYAVNTNEGISRNYNEDRVSIILNITKNGVKSFFFAIYDGHGGNMCCDFLSDNLHQYILNNKKFPYKPRQAIVEGIKQAEEDFLAKTKNNYLLKKELDRSGSCIILALIVGDQCYIANVGDSRAILSTCMGKPLFSLSRDHKPTDTNQQERILKEGGKIYRTEMRKIQKQKKEEEPPIIGPLRVFPGKLSVTRTIGDIEAKDKNFGGLPNCIITDPQICKYKLTGKEDFIILGCDGIFEKMDSEEVVEEAWKAIRKTTTNVHEACGNAVHSIVKTSMVRKSTDNVTAIIIGLSDLGITNTQEYRSI